MTWIAERMGCDASGVYARMAELVRDDTNEMNRRKGDEHLRDFVARIGVLGPFDFECHADAGLYLRVNLVSGTRVRAVVFDAKLEAGSIVAHSGYGDQQRAKTEVRITPIWNKREGKCLLFLKYEQQQNRMVECTKLPLIVGELLEPAFFPTPVA